jgi:acyl-coenzyme A thioesterase PaaI-like protein
MQKNFIMEKVDLFFNDLSPLKLKIFNPILRRVIPFNLPHMISLVSINNEQAVASIPNKRLNHNHLGGIHACAIATLGEFCAGLMIIKHFSITKFRPIMKNLNIEYLYQGKSELKGECSIPELDLARVKAELADLDKSFLELHTSIYDKDKNLVAKVTSLWQIKKWKAVKTKLNS